MTDVPNKQPTPNRRRDTMEHGQTLSLEYLAKPLNAMLGLEAGWVGSGVHEDPTEAKGHEKLCRYHILHKPNA